MVLPYDIFVLGHLPLEGGIHVLGLPPLEGDINVFGHPPPSWREHVSVHPLFEGEICFGIPLMGYNSPLVGYAFMHLGVIFQVPPPWGVMLKDPMGSFCVRDLLPLKWDMTWNIPLSRGISHKEIMGMSVDYHFNSFRALTCV